MTSESGTTRFLLDDLYVRTPFKKEILLLADPLLVQLTIQMLRRAHVRYFTGPSSSSGRFHPADEFFSGPNGDITGAPPNRTGDYGGQVLHCRRVAKFARHLCKAHRFENASREFQLAICASLVHDISQYEDDKKGTVRFHESLVRGQTDDIPDIFPDLAGRWESLVRLCEVHSGQWGKDESYYPVTELEKLIHDADYLASRRETGVTDPDMLDF